jgi:hypothetical protein
MTGSWNRAKKKEAVEKATGKPVIKILLHLPVSGLIIRIYGE